MRIRELATANKTDYYMNRTVIRFRAYFWFIFFPSNESKCAWIFGSDSMTRRLAFFQH